MSLMTAFSPNQPTRSTRGASKQRRDQINVEIQKLRDLLPLNGSIKDRLFQLQVMSLACIFIRKQRYFPHVIQTCDKPGYPLFQRSLPLPRHIDGCKALRGFLLMTTRGGKLLYISENASEYLGYSVEEIMCQGDSIFDLIDSRDHSAVHAELTSGPPSAAAGTFPDERVFICRMNLSRTAKRHIQYYKFILVEGRYLHPSEYYQSLGVSGNTNGGSVQPIFAAFCRPLINSENAETLSTGNTAMFRSVHTMDLKFAHLDEIGSHYLGFSGAEIEGCSFYQMLHPLHVTQIASKHQFLCQQKEGSIVCLLRLQTRTGDFVWLHSVFVVKTAFVHGAPSVSDVNNNTGNGSTAPGPNGTRRVRHLIHATHQVLSELEAATLQANEWIYAIKQHHFTRELSKDEFEESVSPHSSESDLSGAMGEYGMDVGGGGAICVEIPSKQQMTTVLPSHTSSCAEHSSPDSSSSLSTAATKSFCFATESLPPFYGSDASELAMPLPELGDDLDEFFRQVEYSHTNAPANVLGPLHTTTATTAAVKREWWEASVGVPEATDCAVLPGTAFFSPSPTPPLAMYRPHRHHSVQLAHTDCRWSSGDYGSLGHAEGVAYEPFHPSHPRGQKRLASWAGLEST